MLSVPPHTHTLRCLSGDLLVVMSAVTNGNGNNTFNPLSVVSTSLNYKLLSLRFQARIIMMILVWSSLPSLLVKVMSHVTYAPIP